MNKLAVLTGIIFVAAMSRILPHPMNFSPIAAMALLGGAYFGKRSWAIMMPLLSLWFSDLVLNNTIYDSYYEGFTFITPSFYWSYGVFTLLSVGGYAFLQHPNSLRIAGASVSASLLFFLVSNFGVWAESGMYPHDTTGLLSCYVAGLPFLGNTLLGDLFYTGILFALYQFIQNKYLSINPSHPA